MLFIHDADTHVLLYYSKRIIRWRYTCCNIGQTDYSVAGRLLLTFALCTLLQVHPNVLLLFGLAGEEVVVRVVDT